MVKFLLRLKDEQYKKITEVSNKNERSINKQIEYILKQFIIDYEKVNGKIEIEK